MSKKDSNGSSNGARLLRKPRAPRKPIISDTVVLDAYLAVECSNMGTGDGSDDSFDTDGEASPRLVPNKEFTQTSQEQFASGYRDNTYISGASPPPPSEFSKADFDTSSYLILPASRETKSKSHKSESREKTAVSHEKKYIIDPSYRQRTNLGTYVEGQSLMKNYKPRGPAPLPARAPLIKPQPFIAPLTVEDEEPERYYQEAEFTLQDFLLKVSQKEKLPIHKVQEIVYSRHNYKKLQNMLSALMAYPQKQRNIKTVDIQMPDELSTATPRVPQKQLVLEMAALIKEQMSAVMKTEMRPVIKPLPKWSPDYKPGQPRPHTEIVLYEGATPAAKRSRDNTEISIRIQPLNEFGSTNDALFQSSRAHYFQGSRRSSSPLMSGDDGMISPSELAVLDTLISGGSALSLKAHFICEMPDIEALVKTITYLNLSFNDFRSVPMEVFDIENLTVLKLRNNPIREIPPQISRLQKLKTLVFSFCLVATLPVNLFKLRCLEHLDIAYNRISFLPREIKQLKRLKELNLEGNQLPAMSPGVLRLGNLKYLRVRNNFMHPLFWKDNAKNVPQSLTHMAALGLKQYNMEREIHGRVPKPLQDIIDNPAVCDCCKGPLYGPGLRLIRPIERIFGIKNLPFIFLSCSPYCLSRFANSTENMVEMLYGPTDTASEASSH